jgi:hypothetical protein
MRSSAAVNSVFNGNSGKYSEVNLFYIIASDVIRIAMRRDLLAGG